MLEPTFPLVCITDQKWLDLFLSNSNLSRVATSALIDRNYENSISFDGNGIIWSYEQRAHKFRNSFLTRLLAFSFYNPLLDAKVIWKQVGNYQLQDLKVSLKYCVDRDDDIITQFAEASTINSGIDNATSFAEIINVLNKYVFDVNEDLLQKEN